MKLHASGDDFATIAHHLVDLERGRHYTAMRQSLVGWLCLSALVLMDFPCRCQFKTTFSVAPDTLAPQYSARVCT